MVIMRLTLGKAWVAAAKKKKKKKEKEIILVPILLTTVHQLQQSIKVSGGTRASLTHHLLNHRVQNHRIRVRLFEGTSEKIFKACKAI